MTSKNNFNTLTQILTGVDAVAGDEAKACIYTTETKTGFGLHGYPNATNSQRATYDCPKDVCKPTNMSTNAAQAAKYGTFFEALRVTVTTINNLNQLLAYNYLNSSLIL